MLRLVDDQDTTLAGLARDADVTVTIRGRVVDAYEMGGLHHYVIQDAAGRRHVIAPVEDASTIVRS